MLLPLKLGRFVVFKYFLKHNNGYKINVSYEPSDFLTSIRRSVIQNLISKNDDSYAFSPSDAYMRSRYIQPVPWTHRCILNI